jgi:hypothetical protein
MDKAYNRIVDKRTFYMYFHLQQCEGRCCLIYADKPEKLVSVGEFIVRMHFFYYYSYQKHLMHAWLALVSICQ